MRHSRWRTAGAAACSAPAWPTCSTTKPRRSGAVEQAGVEMRHVEMSRQAARERALAGGRRPVDGDQHGAHEKVAPSFSSAGRKVGKLVAIIAASSMVTGLSEARPMTRKLMAMR